MVTLLAQQLENRLFGLANEARRYIVKKGNDPGAGNITEERESELVEFIDYAKIIMGTLGHKVFEKLTDSSLPEETPPDDLLHFVQWHWGIRRNARQTPIGSSGFATFLCHASCHTAILKGLSSLRSFQGQSDFDEFLPHNLPSQDWAGLASNLPS